MKPGIYVKTTTETLCIADIEDIALGDEEGHEALGREVANIIHDETVDLMLDDSDDGVRKITIFIVQ